MSSHRKTSRGSSLSRIATPLTLENVTKSIERVHWRRLCDCLFVPDSKRLEIEKQPEKEHRKLLVEWWLLTDPAPSWRSLIRGLDWFEETLAADEIRNRAEPIQDPTFTLPNVTSAVQTVKHWNQFCNHLQLSLRKRQPINEMLAYFITTVPRASWETLAGQLYYMEQYEALEKVKKYIQQEPEPNLTVSSLIAALEEVEDWERLARELDVPQSKRREIRSTYSDDIERKREMVKEWWNCHPAPSWLLVANALYRMRTGSSHAVLHRLQQKYLEGSSLSLVEIAFSDLEIMEKVGSGGFGTVSKGRWISESKIVAIKMMIVWDEREVRILSSLDHPSIIHYYGTATQNDVHYIVTEFAENGSVYEYIHKYHKQPPLSQILLWAVQVAEGMVYLHQQDIIHRDLKSCNVVLTSALEAKICDLGCARNLEQTAKQTTAVGTYAWMAPEMLRREKVSKSCDVYSYGVLLFEMATQQLPFPDVLPLLVPSMIIEGKRPAIPETCDSHLADLIKSCWQEDAKARPTFEKILVSLNTTGPSSDPPHQYYSWV